jgi:cell wall-associated NlpC family hydrolase
VTPAEAEAAARLLERVLTDRSYREHFRRNPVAAAREAGVAGVAEEMAMGAGKAMDTLDGRESRSSLAGVFMAAALEGAGVYDFSKDFAPHLQGIPEQVQQVLSRAHNHGGLSAPAGFADVGVPRSVTPLTEAAAGFPPAPPNAAGEFTAITPEQAAAGRSAAVEPPAPPAGDSAPAPAPGDGAPAPGRPDPAQYGQEGTGGRISHEATALLHSKRVTFDASGIADLKGGRLDPRLVSVLAAISRDHRISVSAMASDHPKLTSGGSVSNHFHGRALDIATVDGRPVAPGNAAARELAVALSRLDPEIRPSEIGSPWALSGPAYFTDGGHQDHIHVGFDDPIASGWKPPEQVAAPGSGPADAQVMPAVPDAPPSLASGADAPAPAEPGGLEDPGGDTEAQADAESDSGGDDEGDDGGDDDDSVSDDPSDEQENENEADDESDENDENDASGGSDGSDGGDTAHGGAGSDSAASPAPVDDGGDGGDDTDSGTNPAPVDVDGDSSDSSDDGGDSGANPARVDVDGDSSDSSDSSDINDSNDSNDSSDGNDSGANPAPVDVGTASASYPGDSAPPQDVAAWMAGQAQKRGLPSELPVMAALVESGMHNLNRGDADSLGLFQMRMGTWNHGAYAGYPDHAELQLKWFLDQAEAVKQQRVAAGKSVDDPNGYGEWIADVERPRADYRGRYQPRLADARDLLRQAPDSGHDRGGGGAGIQPESLVDNDGSGAGPRALAAVAEAKKHMGTPYQWGGSTPQTGFDCSGLVQWAYAKAGIVVPRTSEQQILASNGRAVDRAHLRAGDLVFFRNAGGDVHHVGISLGGDKFINAPHTGASVRVDDLNQSYYAREFAGGRRFDAAGSGDASAAGDPPAHSSGVDPAAARRAEAALARDAAEAQRPGTLLFEAVKAQELRQVVHDPALDAVDPSSAR